MTDRERILLLLGSLHDFSFFPPGSLRTTSGLGPSAKRPCPDCGLTDTPGWLLDRFKRREPCVTCGGKAGKRAKVGRGWVYVDRMDSERRPIGASDVGATTRPAATVPCDACSASGVGKPHLDEHGGEYRDPCSRCGGSGRRSVTRFELAADDPDRQPSGDALTDAIERRNAAGSYRELEQALAVLPRGMRRLVVAVHVAGRKPPVGEDALARIESGLTFVEAVMPQPIVVPGAVRAAARAARDRRSAVGQGAGKAALVKRDKDIRAEARQGRPTQWLAQKHGLSVSQVNRIVNGKAEAA